MKKAGKVIQNVIWGFVIGVFGILCVLVGWLAVQKFVFRAPVPSVFGYATLSVQTGSMSGTIEAGDLVLIKKTNDYEEGDIVTFLHEGEAVPTMHRIIGVALDGRFITKGDANNTQDSLPVDEAEIFGEVVNVFPKVGLFFNWVQSEGWLYIVAVLVIVCVGTFLVKTMFEPEEESEPAQAEVTETEPTATPEELPKEEERGEEPEQSEQSEQSEKD